MDVTPIISQTVIKKSVLLVVLLLASTHAFSNGVYFGAEVYQNEFQARYKAGDNEVDIDDSYGAKLISGYRLTPEIFYIELSYSRYQAEGDWRGDLGHDCLNNCETSELKVDSVELYHLTRLRMSPRGRVYNAHFAFKTGLLHQRAHVKLFDSDVAIRNKSNHIFFSAAAEIGYGDLGFRIESKFYNRNEETIFSLYYRLD